MRKIFKSVLAITLSTIFAFPAQAATMESIANADSRFHYDGTTLTATIKSAETFSYEEMADSFFNATRTCSGYEIPECYAEYRTNTVIFDQNKANMIIERTTWTDEWVKANVPNTATYVMTREQAKTAVFTYISTNYEYSLDILGYLDKESEASDAYSLIANNTGVCIAFSCAFRAMLESVPFNPSTGLVDWNCVEPDHIRVSIVENGKHMWNAIQNAQGTWGFYDTACASKYRESMMAFYDLLGGQVYDCYGEKIWHY